MSMKFSQGLYEPKNPQKYAGKGSIRYRSSWELKFMQFLDSHPSVKHWASESISIPYKNPIANKTKSYVPDFFIVYEDVSGNRKAEIVEIKPYKETSLEAAGRSQKNQIQAVVNLAKWQAAKAYCDGQGIEFRILTEHDMFAGTKKKKR
jgi:TnsA endonuclease N terminal